MLTTRFGMLFALALAMGIITRCETTEHTPTLEPLATTTGAAESEEPCDNKDNDLDGITDEACDKDGDDFCDADRQTVGAPAPCPNGGGDCDDFDPFVNPNMAEGSSLCNGKDDNCDGEPDNVADNTPIHGWCYDGGAECTQLADGSFSCVGKCDAGFWVCHIGGVSACMEETLPAATESCNNADDDCDGATDENLALGEPCDGDGDSDLCKEGVYQCDSDGTVMCTDHGPDTIEFCNNKDDDCDGFTDEDFAADNGKPCDGPDADLCYEGQFQCSGDGLVLVCNDDLAAKVEVCDGVDNDCNELTDELWPVGEPCDGPDADKCKSGTWQCGPDKMSVVCAEAGQGFSEACNDLDDDCNGYTDALAPKIEGGAPQALKQSCYTGPQGTQGVGSCVAGSQSCLPGAQWSDCEGETTPKPMDEDCDNKDEDCDGATDEEANCSSQTFCVNTDPKIIGEDCYVQKADGCYYQGKIACDQSTGKVYCDSPDMKTTCG